MNISTRGQVVLLSALLSLFSLANCGQRDSIVESLFEGYAERDEKLWLCDGHQEGLKYRMPKEVNCEPPLASVPRKEIALTFFWDDISLQKLKVFECYVEKRTTRVHAKWLEDNFITYSDTTYGKLQYEDCQRMTTDHKDPEGGDLELLRDDYWGTKNKVVPEPGAWITLRESYVDHENVNYYFVILKATVSNADGSLKTSAALLGQCQATDGQCRTARGVLIWKLTDESYNSCRMKQGRTSSCIAAEARITCPFISMTLTKVTQITICGAELGTSEQGIYFSVYNDTSVYPAIDLTETVRQKMKLQASDVTEDSSAPLKVRSKREARFVTSSEMNAHLQYLHTIIETGQNSTFQKLEKETCITQKVQQRHQRFFTEKGDPNLLLFASDPSLRGRLSGDVMAVWTCRQITLYYLLDRSICSLEWPVSYRLGNHLRQGYIRAVSHQIVDRPTLVKCPPPEFYWDLGENGVILLDDKSVANFIPYFPHPYQKQDEEDKEEQLAVAFNTPAAFSHEETTQREVLLDSVQQSANIQGFAIRMQETSDGDTKSPEDSLSLELLRNAFNGGWKATLKIIGISLVTIAVVSGSHLLIPFFKIIWNAITKLFELLGSLFEQIGKTFERLQSMVKPIGPTVESVAMTVPKLYPDLQGKGEPEAHPSAPIMEFGPSVPRRNENIYTEP